MMISFLCIWLYCDWGQFAEYVDQIHHYNIALYEERQQGDNPPRR